MALSKLVQLFLLLLNLFGERSELDALCLHLHVFALDLPKLISPLLHVVQVEVELRHIFLIFGKDECEHFQLLV